MKSFTENLQMQKIGKEMTEELEESFGENSQMRKIGKIDKKVGHLQSVYNHYVQFFVN